MTAIVGARLDQAFTAADIALGLGPKLGEIYEDYRGYQFKFVKYNVGAGSVAAAAGNFAYLYAASGASAGQTTEVTSDLSDSAEVGAGVLQSAPGNGEYCWVMTKGIATLTTALTAGADGDPLTPTGATDGTLDVTAATTDDICATAIDASAKIVRVNCR